MRFLTAIAFALLFCVTSTLPAAGQGPRSISFQGYLTDTLGTPIDGPQNITLKLFEVETAGTEIWTRSYSGVSVSGGVFDVVLENGSPSFKIFTFIDSLWIEVAVASEIMTPRTQLRASPYARGLSLPITAEAEVSTDDQAALEVTNTAVSGSNYAVRGRSSSVSGIGVYGQNVAATGTAYGLLGETMSASGIGVAGNAAKTYGQNWGVVGTSYSPNGVGVFGDAPDVTGVNYGVVGRTNSYIGMAVFGQATSQSGQAIGVSGNTYSPNGDGVRGTAYNTTGFGSGVFGDSRSPTGWAGYFIGGQGVYVQGSDNDGPDLILGGAGGYFDEGRIWSDTAWVDSDIWIEANDAVIIGLDRDGSGEDADFEIRDKNGTVIFNVDEDGTITTTGPIIPPSDRNLKDDIVPVDAGDILEEVARLPISRWRYKGQPAPHVGPMAQDFYAAFGVGANDKGIATVDADGVSLAAIQGLYALVREQGNLLAAQQAEIERMRASMAAAGL